MGKILIKRKKHDISFVKFVYIEKYIKHIYRETNFVFTIAHTCTGDSCERDEFKKIIYF